MRKSSNTLREKHDLSDELAVGLNHRERAEELLQIIGQIRTARVAGIHRDKDAMSGLTATVFPTSSTVICAAAIKETIPQ